MEEFKFNEETHEYTLNGKVIPSVTQILEKTLFEKKYDGVSEETLKKAAEYGTLIHKEIESYIKRGVVGFTEELYNFITIKEDNKLNKLQSEVKVHTDKMAGTIDILGVKGITKHKNILADIKTTYKLDKEYVSWQLSFYAYIVEHTTDTKIEELYAIWLRENKCEFVKVERKTDEQVEEVLMAYENGSRIDFTTTTTLQTIPEDKQIAFCGIMKQIKEMEEKTKEIKEAIKKEMEERGIDKVEIGDITISYRKASLRTTIDTNALKKDNLYEKYSKVSAVQPSIAIKIKD